METKFDYILNYLLDTWVIAILAIIAIGLKALPQLRDSIKMLCSFFNKKKKEFVSEYADEKTTIEVKLRSQDFDIVKIHATTHILGVRTEYEWLQKNYPDYEHNTQFLNNKTTNDGRNIIFDIFPIHKGNKKKYIYFDITEFYEGAHVPYSGNVDKYAEQKIKEIYNKKY